MTTGTSALLADGDMVTVRRLRAEDFDAVLNLHQRLDERDRYLRFFTAHPGRLDLLSRLAIEGPGIGAFRGDELIGIAHYRPGSADDAAEVALVVDHAAQAHGSAPCCSNISCPWPWRRASTVSSPWCSRRTPG